MLNGVMAAGFSPSSLIFDVEQDQDECQVITITSESETVVVSDSWAADSSDEWKVSSFETDASEHGIDISYDDLLEGEDSVEVCLSGSELGEYHGVILLREEQQGNSVVQMGVWLKVTISEPAPEPEPISGPTSSGGSSQTSSDDDGGSGGSATVNIPELDDEQIGEVLDEASGGDDEENQDAGITGGAVGVSNAKKGIGIGVLAIIVIAGIVVYNKKYRRKI